MKFTITALILILSTNVSAQLKGIDRFREVSSESDVPNGEKYCTVDVDSSKMFFLFEDQTLDGYKSLIESTKLLLAANGFKLNQPVFNNGIYTRRCGQ